MNRDEESQVQDTMFLASGVALMVLGAGLLLARPSVRRALTSTLTPLLPEDRSQLGERIGGILPDVERYLKIKSM
jgi:hypothetical protein